MQTLSSYLENKNNNNNNKKQQNKLMKFLRFLMDTLRKD